MLRNGVRCKKSPGPNRGPRKGTDPVSWSLMPFPDFTPGKKKILFFSRGRGRGHAVPDIEIVRELQRVRDDVEVRFVSYGTGARTIEELGFPLVDLGLPEANGTAETTVLAGKMIGWLNPDLVVAHEEFAALPAAKIFDKPTVMVLDYFTDPEMYSMQSLRFADHVLFMDRKGVHPEPPSAKGKVRYLGPVVRSFAYTRGDRVRARIELGIADEATVLSVFPGSWTEAETPILKRVSGAFDALKARPKHLFWVAGSDYRIVCRALKGRSDVTVLEADWTIERLMVASNLAITKGSRKTTRELAALGIRTLSVSFGLNPPDNRAAAALPSNRTITAGQITAALMTRTLKLPDPPPQRFKSRSAAAEMSKILDLVHKQPAVERS